MCIEPNARFDGDYVHDALCPDGIFLGDDLNRELIGEVRFASCNESGGAIVRTAERRERQISKMSHHLEDASLRIHRDVSTGNTENRVEKMLRRLEWGLEDFRWPEVDVSNRRYSISSNTGTFNAESDAMLIALFLLVDSNEYVHGNEGRMNRREFIPRAEIQAEIQLIEAEMEMIAQAFKRQAQETQEERERLFAQSRRPNIVMIPFYPSHLMARFHERHLQEIIARSNASVDKSKILLPPLLSTGEPKTTDDAKQCTICCDNEKSAILVPCGHAGYCVPCMRRLVETSEPICPLCREPITQVMRIFAN